MSQILRTALPLFTLGLSLALPGCAVPDRPADPIDPQAPVAPELAGLSACAFGDGALEETWSVANGHGEISALALSETGTVAVAGAGRRALSGSPE